MARPFRIIDSSNPEWNPETVPGNAFRLVVRPRIPIPQPDFVDGPSQYDLSTVCGPHRLHNSADTEGICGKKRPEMP